MTVVCDICLNTINLHSSNTDLFTNKKFDIYFCKKCSTAKTYLPKEFDFKEHYPQNYYGQDGKKFNFIINNYPNTDFALDSKFKIGLIEEVMASKEM